MIRSIEHFIDTRIIQINKPQTGGLGGGLGGNKAAGGTPSFGGKIGTPVQLIHNCTIAYVETRDSVQWFAPVFSVI